VLVEHYAGAFPLWLAPVQIDILPVTDKAADFAFEVRDRLRAEGFRAEVDARNEKLGYKIRESQLNKVPYALVIGEREVAERQVTPRRRGGEQLPSMTLDAFVETARAERNNRAS
jgi:threonyl-tRNA synthetase